jgi:hypothetical protein
VPACWQHILAGLEPGCVLLPQDVRLHCAGGVGLRGLGCDAGHADAGALVAEGCLERTVRVGLGGLPRQVAEEGFASLERTVTHKPRVPVEQARARPSHGSRALHQGSRLVLELLHQLGLLCLERSRDGASRLLAADPLEAAGTLGLV